MSDGRLKYRPKDNLKYGVNGLMPLKDTPIRGKIKSGRYLSHFKGDKAKKIINDYSKY